MGPQNKDYSILDLYCGLPIQGDYRMGAFIKQLPSASSDWVQERSIAKNACGLVLPKCSPI